MGVTNFSMLGLDYNVNLHEMVSLNYDKLCQTQVKTEHCNV